MEHRTLGFGGITWIILAEDEEDWWFCEHGIEIYFSVKFLGKPFSKFWLVYFLERQEANEFVSYFDRVLSIRIIHIHVILRNVS
jgi:hypothetical protein